MTGAVGAAAVPDGATGAGSRDCFATPSASEPGNAGNLNPDWVEWLMGWPVGWTHLDSLDSADIRPWTEDPADSGEIPRVTLTREHRKDRLKCIGNGQVPATAAKAWRQLRARFDQ